MGHDSHHEHHVIPAKLLMKVLLGLVVLTVLTVVTAKGVHLGLLAGPVAFLIAAVKAYFVMSYFMGLKYDDKMNRIIFGTGFVFVAILFIFCALDIFTRSVQTNPL